MMCSAPMDVQLLKAQKCGFAFPTSKHLLLLSFALLQSNVSTELTLAPKVAATSITLALFLRLMDSFNMFQQNPFTLELLFTFFTSYTFSRMRFPFMPG